MVICSEPTFDFQNSSVENYKLRKTTRKDVSPPNFYLRTWKTLCTALYFSTKKNGLKSDRSVTGASTPVFGEIFGHNRLKS